MVTCNLAIHLYPLENLLGATKWLPDVKVVNINSVRQGQFWQKADSIHMYKCLLSKPDLHK